MCLCSVLAWTLLSFSVVFSSVTIYTIPSFSLDTVISTVLLGMGKGLDQDTIEALWIQYKHSTFFHIHHLVTDIPSTLLQT